MNKPPTITKHYGLAVFKNIPIQCLAQVQQTLTCANRAGQLGDCRRIRYRFRGPRIDTGFRYTLKKDAHSFSVYFDYPIHYYY